MLEEFQTKYMKSGFEIISGMSRIAILLTMAGVLLFPSHNNPNYKRVLIVYPLLFTLWVVIEKNIETNRYVKEYSFVIFQLLIGLSVIHSTEQKIF